MCLTIEDELLHLQIRSSMEGFLGADRFPFPVPFLTYSLKRAILKIRDIEPVFFAAFT